MAITTHMARITGPVAYLAAGGKQMNIPLGPCLVEQGEGKNVDIVWGTHGQCSIELPLQDLETAEGSGFVVLLD